MYISDRRYYLAADGETVVGEGDPRAATLLVGEGGQLSDEDAARYGLTRVRATAAEELVEEPAEEPKGKLARANKARKPAEDK